MQSKGINRTAPHWQSTCLAILVQHWPISLQTTSLLLPDSSCFVTKPQKYEHSAGHKSSVSTRPISDAAWKRRIIYYVSCWRSKTKQIELRSNKLLWWSIQYWPAQMEEWCISWPRLLLLLSMIINLFYSTFSQFFIPLIISSWITTTRNERQPQQLRLPKKPRLQRRRWKPS